MEVQEDRMRDKTEGMELFYVTPALTGAGLGHSRKATQVDPTRAISRHCPLLTVVLPLGLPGVGPAQLCTYSAGVPHRGPLHSAFLSFLKRTLGKELWQPLSIQQETAFPLG